MTDIRALSIRQPWAWAVCAGVKRTENRTWTTEHRGTIAIHASTSMQVVNAFKRESGCELFSGDWFTTGAIIGFADIVDIASYGPQHESDPFAEGPYCWTMGNARFLKESIPLPGKLNLFKLTGDVQQRLREADTHEVDLDQVDVRAIVKAMHREPDPVASYDELYQEYLHNGNHADAVKVGAERLIALAPTESIGYLLRGGLQSEDRTPSENVADLRRASELDPKNAMVWYLLSDVYLVAKRFQDSLAAAERLVALAPDSFGSYELRARAFYHLGNYAACIQDCDHSIQLKPDHAIAWAMRGEAKVAIGDKPGGKRDLDHAVALSKGDEFYKSIRTAALA